MVEKLWGANMNVSRAIIGITFAALAWLFVAGDAQARFLQTDPVGYQDDLNWYAYVTNDPMNKQDPTGKEDVSAVLYYAGVGKPPGYYLTPAGEEEEARDASQLADIMDALGASMQGVPYGAPEGKALQELAGVTREVATLEEAEAAAARATVLNGKLDPIAQDMRTTAVLNTDKETIVASGGRDLSPVQRQALKPGETAASPQPGAHAEATALDHAAANGANPKSLGTSRAICSSCKAKIESSGGKVTGDRTAIWPKTLNQ